MIFQIETRSGQLPLICSMESKCKQISALEWGSIPRIFSQPAKFDNFKDEKISDCKTVSVPKKKKLAGLKIGGLVGLWATFEGSLFMFSGSKIFFKFFLKIF